MMNEPPLMNFPSGNFDEKKKENKKILLLMNILKKNSRRLFIEVQERRNKVKEATVW